MSMLPPPSHLDGAEVAFWARSPGQSPFFDMPAGDTVVPIYGLAICRDAKSGAVYRFSCDRAWEVQNDAPFDTVDAAMKALSGDYDVTKVLWVRASV